MVAADELDADLHIETTSIMFAHAVESVRLIERDEASNVIRIRSPPKRFEQEVVRSRAALCLNVAVLAFQLISRMPTARLFLFATAISMRRG